MNLITLQKFTKNLKVLYAEDFLTIRKATYKILAPYFDYIDLAEDGEEAITLYREFYETNDTYYDIVITDLDMPIMDGQKLSKMILDFNSTQDIIVISGINDLQKVINLVNNGLNKFIIKPVEDKKLRSVLVSVVENIRKKSLQENEKSELTEYNDILKEREVEHEKALESKMKELQEFNDALDSSAIVAKTDLDGVLTYINKHYCDISGYKKEELLGQNSSILNSGKRSKSYYQKLWNTINNKKIYKTLFENKTKDGSIFYIDTTIKPILNIEGDIVEFIAVSHDMTQLMNALETAHKAQKAKEDSFMNISHEMKTPLNSILGFSSLLKKRLAEDSKSLLMANTIFDTGTDLNKLVESILDMQKIQNNTLELIESTFEPYSEIIKCIKTYEQKAKDKNQRYETFVDQTLPKLLSGTLQECCK